MRNFGATPASILIQVQNMQNNLKNANLVQRGEFLVPKIAPPLDYAKLLKSFQDIKARIVSGNNSPVSSEDDKRALRYATIIYGLNEPLQPPQQVFIPKMMKALNEAMNRASRGASAPNTSAQQAELNRIIELGLNGASNILKDGKPLTQVGVFSVPSALFDNPTLANLFGNESTLIQMLKGVAMDLEFGQLGNIGDMAFGIMVTIIALSSSQMPTNREELRQAVEILQERLSAPQNNVNAYNTNVPNNTNYPSNVNFNYEVNNVNEPSLPFFETFLGKASVVAGVGAISFGIFHLFFKNK